MDIGDIAGFVALSLEESQFERLLHSLLPLTVVESVKKTDDMYSHVC